MCRLLVVPALPSKTCTLDYLTSIIKDQISSVIRIKWSDRSNRLCRAYFPSIQFCLSNSGTCIVWNDLGCEVFSSAESLLQKSWMSPVDITVATKMSVGNMWYLRYLTWLLTNCVFDHWTRRRCHPMEREREAFNAKHPSCNSSCVRKKFLSPPCLHQEGKILFSRTQWLWASFSKPVLLQSGFYLLLEEL